MRFITEVPDTIYFPIDNPLIKNEKNAEITLEGEDKMRITPGATLRKNINEVRAQGYEVDDDNGPVPDNIPNKDTQRYIPTYNTRVWDGIDCRKTAGHRHERARMSGFGE